jgi:RHS repeat-associated protein
VVYYVVGDHLGTTNVVLDGNGDKLTETRHYPYGVERWPNDGTMPTDYRFTGARLEQPLGIYQMGARWFDPALGRWISADTIVPDFTNPQSLNRFSWVLGNPLAYVDPTGYHPDQPPQPMPDDEPCAIRGDCWPLEKLPPDVVILLVVDVNGVRYMAVGTAIETNAILTCNHLPLLANTQRISIFQPSQTPLLTAQSGDFDMAGDAELGGGLTLLVFKDDFISPADTALLGDADGLEQGDAALQAVLNGARPGLYRTRVENTDIPVTNVRKVEYQALTVAPDKTVAGDSGAPLYVDGRVYAVNNAGNGIYGPVRKISYTRTLVAALTWSLRPRLHSVPQMR